jgi:DNA-3-methyladenine glycosylase
VARGGLGRRRLPRSFFARGSLDVAPRLLNKVLVHDDAAAGVRLAVRIVEVEAYLGALDPGSHAYRGPTRRNAVMFGPAGHLYVYFTYGMHWCANVVTGRPGEGTAVLLRAGAPLEGIEVMAARRPRARAPRDLCSGPARLAQALGLTGADNGSDLCGRHAVLWIADDGTPPPDAPGVSTRIGLRLGTEHPWRWYVAGDPNVSRGPAARPASPPPDAALDPGAPSA